MSRASARAWMQAGQGLQGLGSLLQDRLRYRDDEKRRDESTSFSRDMAERADARGVRAEERAESQFDESNRRWDATQERSDLLSGVSVGPEGLQYNPNQSASFRNTAAGREAGHHIPWQDPEKRALDLALGSGRLQEMGMRGQAIQRDLDTDPRQERMLSWGRPQMNPMSGQLMYPDVGRLDSLMQAIERLGNGGPAQPRSSYDDEIDALTNGR